MKREYNLTEVIRYFNRPNNQGVKMFTQGNDIVLLSLDVDVLLNISDTDLQDGLIHEWDKSELNNFFKVFSKERIEAGVSVLGNEYWTARALHSYTKVHFEPYVNTLPIIKEWRKYLKTVRNRCDKTGRFVGKWNSYKHNRKPFARKVTQVHRVALIKHEDLYLQHTVRHTIR